MTTRTFKFKDEVAEATMHLVDLTEEMPPVLFIESSVPYRGLPPDHPLIVWMVGNIEQLHELFDGREVNVVASTPDDLEQYTISG